MWKDCDIVLQGEVIRLGGGHVLAEDNDNAQDSHYCSSNDNSSAAGHSYYTAFMTVCDVLNRDVQFLTSMNCMDYSLLVDISHAASPISTTEAFLAPIVGSHRYDELMCVVVLYL